ncbi:MAG: hypothetical protein Q9160_008612 [Pyrenula sp. 1 TL-2023]
MSWTEISAGKYQRPIGENEIFIKLVGDPGHALAREHWAINSTSTFTPTGRLTEENLAVLFLRSWKILRFKHPSIAAYVGKDEKTLCYDVPDATALDKWATETFRVISDSTADDVIATFKPGPYATLTYFSETNELLGHTAHWRTDGIGVLYLLDAFLSLASDPTLPCDPSTDLPWGKEPDRLAPSVEEAASISVYPSPTAKDLGQKYVETFYAAAGAVGTKYEGTPETLPAGTRSARLSLSEAETRAVVEACKRHEISVTAAVHASIAAANYALATDENGKKHYTSTVRFSLRPYLLAPYSGPEYAAGLYTTGWTKSVPADSSWDERAKDYHGDYRAGLSQEYVSAHREYAAGLGNLLRNMLPPGDEPPSEMDISSIGVVDEKLVGVEKGTKERGLKIENVSVGVEILTRQCVCFVWTFRGRLAFNVVYNEAFHRKDDMEHAVKIVKKTLLSELGL